jgi:putative transcriptional regulator
MPKIDIMSNTKKEQIHESLAGNFLIAMPSLANDDFARSVIYVCNHSEHGAMGLVINKASEQKMSQLFEKVDLPLGRADLQSQPVYQGGPVQTERGFVLHERMDEPQEVRTPEELLMAQQKDLATTHAPEVSEDTRDASGTGGGSGLDADESVPPPQAQRENENEEGGDADAEDLSNPASLQAVLMRSIKTQLALVASQQTAYDLSLRVPGGIEMTSSRDVLEALSSGLGPTKVFMSLGYAAWGEGQLEAEIARNDWLTVVADKGLIFDEPAATRYEKALGLLGFKSWMLSAQTGNA